MLMGYYHVWVASSSYRRDEPLTYSSDDKLAAGSIIKVPLQQKSVLGIVVRPVSKPAFAVRPIKEVVSSRSLPEQLLDLIDWLVAYYPASRGSVLLSCLPSSLITATVKAPRTKITHQAVAATTIQPALTTQQKQAIEVIGASPISSTLLHGDTGSGKTRVYAEIAQNCISNNRSAIILTPEIGLTSQLAANLRVFFGHRVVVFHSQLTSRERRTAWQTIAESREPLVVIGPRSALFTPLHNIGLVVMDEAHESAYKQEQAPHYQTSRVAATLARLHKAHFIMGTATPLVADYYVYKAKGLPIIRLSSAAIKSAVAPQVRLVSLGDREQFTRSPYISEPLRLAIEQSLKAGEQSLVFLNRRGSARIVLCQQCGWQALCPHCDTALTFHADRHELRCHLCGYKAQTPTTCPKCSNTDITFRSAGTKTVVTELTRLFPNARISRFDTDNHKHERLENVYRAVHDGNIDILVGTQMLGKGLDLPKLSVVGVVQADTSLLIPDYTADETTYQQLVQIMGRVGRGHRAGNVIIQSHSPDNVVIQAAIARDYNLFYETQIKEREQFAFPPFVHLLKLTFHRANPKSSESGALKLKQALMDLKLPIEINGPSPAFHEKRAGRYYWQLIIKSRQRSALLAIIHGLPGGWSHDIDPTSLL